MSMTPENATSWRDIADQLTPKQIAELERNEQGYRDRAKQPKPWWSAEPRSDTEIDRLFLHLAQKAATDNLHDVLFADVALPDGAVRAVSGDAWEDVEPQPYRVIFGADRAGVTGHDVQVSTAAIQLADGSIDDGQVIEEPNISLLQGGIEAISGLTPRARSRAGCDAARGRRDGRVVRAMSNMVDDVLWAVRSPTIARVNELMDRVSPADLTTLEVLAIAGVLEAADQRVNARIAPVLQLHQARGSI
jgi:hypothetical protein